MKTYFIRILPVFSLIILLNFLFNCTPKSFSYKPVIPSDIGETIKVAILDFENDPESPNSGSTFSEIFMDALMELTQGKYIPLERSKIANVLKEFSLSQSGLIDEGESKKIGKMVGADAVIMGKVTLWKKGTIF